MNRYALILTPTKELIEWANSLFPEEESIIDYSSIQGHDSSDVFLIDEFETVEDAIEWLKENYFMFLEEMLFGWVEDEELWPNDMDWPLFEKFIHYSLQSVVYDISSESGSSEDLLTFNLN